MDSPPTTSSNGEGKVIVYDALLHVTRSVSKIPIRVHRTPSSVKQLAKRKPSIDSIETPKPSRKPALSITATKDKAAPSFTAINDKVTPPDKIPKQGRSLWSIVFSLLSLIGFLIVYSVCGAFLFVAIEGPNEVLHVVKLEEAREELLSQAYLRARQINTSEEQFAASMNITLKKYVEVLTIALKNGIQAGVTEPRWTLRGSVFFCMTIFTTIGYGNVSPSTNFGQVAMIVYGIIAIPVFVIIMGKVGSYLAFGLNYLLKSYQTWRTTCAKRMTHDNTRKDSFLMPLLSRASIHVPWYEAIEDEELKAGPTVAFSVGVMYMVLGSFMYKLWEPWSFIEAFYFIFVSLSTIGFGDYVPTKPMYFMFSSLYLMIGLALVSMVINVLISFYTSAYAKAHDKIEQSTLCSCCRK